MMGEIRQYILSVTAAAMLCGILDTFSTGKGTAPAVKLISGIFLAFVVISPITRIDLSALPAVSDSYLDGAQEAIAAGENLSREAYAAIIKSETEAYILDKAKTLDVQLRAEVILDADAVPVGVRLSGDVSPFAKGSLTDMIEDDLGIPKEDQQWIE